MPTLSMTSMLDDPRHAATMSKWRSQSRKGTRVSHKGSRDRIAQMQRASSKTKYLSPEKASRFGQIVSEPLDIALGMSSEPVELPTSADSMFDDARHENRMKSWREQSRKGLMISKNPVILARKSKIKTGFSETRSARNARAMKKIHATSAAMIKAVSDREFAQLRSARNEQQACAISAAKSALQNASYKRVSNNDQWSELNRGSWAVEQEKVDTTVNRIQKNNTSRLEQLNGSRRRPRPYFSVSPKAPTYYESKLTYDNSVLGRSKMSVRGVERTLAWDGE